MRDGVFKFPKEWAGLNGEELVMAAGLNGEELVMASGVEVKPQYIHSKNNEKIY